jgi:PH and SEC7 domain-containing protein
MRSDLPFPDVVHAISYSLLLLNTDLHVADISTRMSRSQFVRNTFAVIQPQVKASGSERPLSLNPLDSTGSAIDEDDDGTAEGSAQDQGSSTVAALNSTPNRHPPKKRSESLTSWKNSVNNTSQSVVQLGGAVSDSPEASRVSINLPTGGFFDSPARRGSRDTSAPLLGGKSWEYEMDNLLKVMVHARLHTSQMSNSLIV